MWPDRIVAGTHVVTYDPRLGSDEAHRRRCMAPGWSPAEEAVLTYRPLEELERAREAMPYYAVEARRSDDGSSAYEWWKCSRFFRHAACAALLVARDLVDAGFADELGTVILRLAEYGAEGDPREAGEVSLRELASRFGACADLDVLYSGTGGSPRDLIHLDLDDGAAEAYVHPWTLLCAVAELEGLVAPDAVIELRPAPREGDVAGLADERS